MRLHRKEKDMIDMNYVATETGQILSMLDSDEFPESYNYLASLLEDDEISASPFEIAGTLIHLDAPDNLPDCLIDFVTELYEMEISEGNAESMNDLGAQYYDGHRGFEQNFQLAMKYYHMAALNGSRQAQENLGYCYYYGRDGHRDYEKAFHYFALGAFDGHLISLYKIGDMYLNGLYVEKNEREAFHIFMRCAQTMTEEAEARVAGPIHLRLGNMFLDGIGTEKDLKSALFCFQKAEFFLFDMVMNGDSMYRKSLKAAQNGLERARAALTEALPDDAWTFD